jgi:hypothetical protein
MVFIKGNTINLGRKHINCECHTIEFRKELYEKHKNKIKKWFGKNHIQTNTGRTWFKKGQHNSPQTEFKKGYIPWNKGKECPSIIGNKNPMNNLIVREKYRKKYWNDKDWEEKRIKASLKGLLKRPTKLEQTFMKFIQKYNLPYRYVGDGSFLIGFKNPDFVNVNGKKICIEVANTIHHSKDYEKQRIGYFAKWGWKCLVFFVERENDIWNLEEQDILNQIRKGFG